MKYFDENFYKGKARQFDDGTKKERVRITRAIRRALDEIEGGKPIEQTPFRKMVARHFREAFGNISLYKMSYNPKKKSTGYSNKPSSGSSIPPRPLELRVSGGGRSGR